MISKGFIWQKRKTWQFVLMTQRTVAIYSNQFKKTRFIQRGNTPHAIFAEDKYSLSILNIFLDFWIGLICNQFFTQWAFQFFYHHVFVKSHKRTNIGTDPEGYDWILWRSKLSTMYNFTILIWVFNLYLHSIWKRHHMWYF